MKTQGKPMASLYFIAILPDPFFKTEVVRIKEYIKEEYGSGHALRSPAHITLHMPFKWRDDRIEKLNNVLKDFAAGRQKFKVDLKNFDAFPPRVIFIKVEENQNLDNLHWDLDKTAREQLKLQNAQYKQRGFHPHMTVAFRDLKKAAFKNAWMEFEFRELEYSFEARSITLLKHNGKKWEEFREFRF
jgi:2'-5' RNA ligase